MLLLLYLTTCIFVGWLATLRGHNLFLYSLLSVIITPLITLIIVLFLVPANTAQATRHIIKSACPSCNHALQHLKSIEYCPHCGDAL